MKKQHSTKDIEKWAETKCESCGGHGGGHFGDCKRRISAKYSTQKEAQKEADFENMGRDYGTAVVVKEVNAFIIKII